MPRTISQIYADWRATLKKPDDSIFWYHPNLDTIILGLAMFDIAVRPILPKLGKAESLKIFHLHINKMVTAWIDDDPEAFEYPFKTLMTLSESLYIICPAFVKKYPRLKKAIEHFYYTFIYWVPIAGETKNAKVQALLDTITTDGKTIESEIVKQAALKIQPIVLRAGMDLDITQATGLFDSAILPLLKANPK